MRPSLSLDRCQTALAPYTCTSDCCCVWCNTTDGFSPFLYSRIGLVSLSGRGQKLEGSIMIQFACDSCGKVREPSPRPDPEPQPGSEPDVIPPVNPEPEPDTTPDVVPPEPEPAPM